MLNLIHCLYLIKLFENNIGSILIMSEIIESTNSEKDVKMCHLELSDMQFFESCAQMNEKRLGHQEIEENVKIRSGKWLRDEHQEFVRACEKHGNNWQMVLYI